MQQTVDAVAETKDQMIVDVDLETILASGLSYFFRAVVTVVILLSSVMAEDVAVAEITTAVSGLSFFYSAADVTEICGKKSKTHTKTGSLRSRFILSIHKFHIVNLQITFRFHFA